jgi:type II secretory ATPase GspE/PulE/Tfp pilus assembly ATPase PilB-like protein
VSEVDKETLLNIKNSLAATPKDELLWRVWEEKLKNPKFFQPVWCEHCDNSWYKGRVWLYEVLNMTDGVKEMVLAWESAFNINKQAIKDGMISLEQDGIIKALNGLTSLAEVYSVAKSQSNG